jgi:hypothetical protein
MKTKKLIIPIIISSLGLTGAVLWNAPGIKSRRLGGQCNKQYIEAIKSADTAELQVTFKNARDICYTNIAREYQNTQLCDLIDSKDMKSLCNINVYYWNKNEADCETDEQRNICLHIQSVKNNDKSLCEEITNQSVKEACLK